MVTTPSRLSILEWQNCDIKLASPRKFFLSSSEAPSIVNYIHNYVYSFMFLPFNSLTATTVPGSSLMIPDATPFTTLNI